MAYTKHGHYIIGSPNTISDSKIPARSSFCTRLETCGPCSMEVIAWQQNSLKLPDGLSIELISRVFIEDIRKQLADSKFVTRDIFGLGWFQLAKWEQELIGNSIINVLATVLANLPSSLASLPDTEPAPERGAQDVYDEIDRTLSRLSQEISKNFKPDFSKEQALLKLHEVWHWAGDCLPKAYPSEALVTRKPPGWK